MRMLFSPAIGVAIAAERLAELAQHTSLAHVIRWGLCSHRLGHALSWPFIEASQGTHAAVREFGAGRTQVVTSGLVV